MPSIVFDFTAIGGTRSEAQLSEIKTEADVIKAAKRAAPPSEELVEARRQLEIAQRRVANYSGNNPNKYRAALESARFRVRQLEEAAP